jgi:hypothetical protein
LEPRELGKALEIHDTVPCRLRAIAQEGYQMDYIEHRPFKTQFLVRGYKKWPPNTVQQGEKRQLAKMGVNRRETK